MNMCSLVFLASNTLIDPWGKVFNSVAQRKLCNRYAVSPVQAV